VIKAEFPDRVALGRAQAVKTFGCLLQLGIKAADAEPDQRCFHFDDPILVAWRENTLKLTPPERIVAPKGKLTPAWGGAAEVLASALDIDHFSPARRDFQQCACQNTFVAAVIDLVGARETVLHARARDIDLSQQHRHLMPAGFGREARL
jgi:hypothetical protein